MCFQSSSQLKLRGSETLNDLGRWCCHIVPVLKSHKELKFARLQCLYDYNTISGSELQHTFIMYGKWTITLASSSDKVS